MEQKRKKPSFELNGKLTQNTTTFKCGDVKYKTPEAKKPKIQEREKPSFEPSGKLTHDTPTFKSGDVKYTTPEAKKPNKLQEREKPSFEPSGKLAQKKNAFKSGDVKYEAESSSSSAAKLPKLEEREKPSFEPSGKLAQDTNTFKGVVVKYNEPPEAKLPKLRWRMYPFKGDEEMPVIYIHRQSAYLIGRDRKIADFPVDHPSCSKQHAAIQYRSMPYERLDGTRGRRTRPYIIDLGSANGTYLNGQRIEAQRYYELKENDVLKFGFSSREYVMLHEQSLHQGDESDTGSEEEDEVGGVDKTGGEERLALAEEDNLF